MAKVIASPAAEAVEAAPANIVTLRTAVGEAHTRQYGAVKEYAVALCEFLPNEWFEVEHNSMREEDKPVLIEAQAFRNALRAAGHKNPSVIWTRVREAGRIHIHGEPEAKGGAKHTRSLQLRLVEELTALFKACKREESLTTQQQNAMTGIASALSALGVDLASITGSK